MRATPARLSGDLCISDYSPWIGGDALCSPLTTATCVAGQSDSMEGALRLYFW